MSDPAALLGELIAAQAARTPEAVAIQQWDARLTYRELVEAAAQLASRLRELGVGPEVRVGVCARRTPWLPVAALGVMLAGGAYVPLDPGHPRRRLRGILDDAGIAVVVADEHGRALLEDSGRQLVIPAPEPAEPRPTRTAAPPQAGSGAPGGTPPTHGVAEPRPEATRGSAESRPEAATGPAPPSSCLAPDNAAYVLYTSGSTGRPKGVVVSHRSVAAFVNAAADHFALDESCRAIAFSALGFDVSVLDLFAPLTRGAAVQLVGDDDRIDPARLQRFLEAHEVTWGFIPPALLPLLDPERLDHLRDLVTAGEPPGPEQVARWSAPPRRRFHNWYGPTEATVCVIGTELTGHWDRPVPIGRPLTGCRILILDGALRPCPPGVPGELHLGGPQVARGYLGRPGLTAERFVPEPGAPEPGARLYKTGDLARWDADGRVEYLGRLDRQVKIQGQRVELGEVEAVLRAHPDVLQAVVDAGDGEDLVAYLTPATAPDLDRLRDHCAARLPAYMLPTRAVRLAALPLNTSGKVDMAVLRAGARTGAAPVTSPSDPTARRVAEIWAQVLESPPRSPDADFFSSGGHSLRAMRVVSALRQELGVDVAVEDVLSGRTLSGLVERVRAAGPVDDERPPRGTAPTLSPAQHRIWFVEQLSPGTAAHNIAMAERVHGPIDVAALRGALAAVVERHEVLRWRVRHEGGVPSVTVDPPGEVPLPVDDLSGSPADVRYRALRDLLQREARTPLDLASGPLLRARLVRVDAHEHVLMVTVHHLVFDGWSQDVFYRDLTRAYGALLRQQQPADVLDPLRVGFGDYVAWLRTRTADAGPRQLGWWKDHLAGVPTVLDLPLDAARPPVQTFGGASSRAEMDPELGAAVHALARRLGTTPYAVLLTAFGQLLRRLTGQEDLVVGTPYADRRHQAFEPLIGFCLQILPLRLRTDDGASFAEHVRRSQQEVTEAIEHCDTPFERIVDSLGVARDLNRSPLVQALFNMYNFAEPHLHLEDCTAEPFRAGLPGSMFDLTLYVSRRGDGFSLELVYNPDLFTVARMESFLAGYLTLLTALVRRSEAPVGEAVLRPPSSPLPGWRTPLPSWDGAGVVELVDAASGWRPDAVAISGAGGALTYGELDELRRRTAAAVRRAGIGRGQTVAVLAARHVELPALLLGVLTAGARWAVLDPAHPPAVLARQAAAADARALLPCPGAPPIAELAHLPAFAPAEGSGEDVFAAAPAARGYLGFTSGSTGEPKPVVTRERPLAHFLDRYRVAHNLGPNDRFALLSGLAHDPALRDMFAPLAVGARLCVPEQDWLRDPDRLAAWCAEQEITVAHLTPQLARLLYRGSGDRRLEALRLVLLGGDQTTAADVTELRRLAPNARLVNVYGTTETPQVHAWHEIRAAGDGPRPVPVGRGLDGSLLVVTDASGRPAGVGELGEVVVRSRYLAAGYLDPALTADRFAATPGADDAYDRVYRTRDLGRYRPDGAVELVGRTDDQVKIRGFRVELGEIATALLAHPDVADAAAVATATNGADVGERAIRAFAVPARAGLQPQELLDHLRARVPEYAVPAGVELLTALPRTPSGKVDRAALRGPARRAGGGPADELSDDTERAVAEVWRSVLGVAQVEPSANFFELGGNSLAIIAVQARLHRRLGREVAVVDLFRHPTVRSLAAHLGGDTTGPGLDRAARRAAARRERGGRRLEARTRAERDN